MEAAGSTPVLRQAWDRQSQWSQTANALKSQVSRARTGVLALTVLAAVLGTGAAIAGLDSRGGKWLAFGSAAFAGLAGVGRLLSDQTAVQNWTRARSVAEAIKSEVFACLAGAGDYASGDREATLGSRLAKFERDAPDLRPQARSATPMKRDLPPVSDAESYATERVQKQMTGFYDSNATAIDGKIRLARTVEVVLAAVGALLAAAAGTWELDDVAVWVPVVTTVTAAITAHAAAERYEYLRLEYSRTAARLEELLDRFQRRELDGGAFVKECEDVISNQNQAWMIKLASPDEEKR